MIISTRNNASAIAADIIVDVNNPNVSTLIAADIIAIQNINDAINPNNIVSLLFTISEMPNA